MQTMAYYIMRQDTSIEGSRSIDGIPENIDVEEWIQGKTVPHPGENIVIDVSLESGEYRGDIMDGFLTFYSDELKEALESLGATNVEYYPIRLRDQETNTTEGGYWLVNIIGRYDCIDLEKSEIERHESDIDETDFEILTLAIDKNKTNGAKIFRLHTDPTLVIINQELKDYFDKTDMLVGVELIQTEMYSEW
jgi:hypothetical protein